MLRLIGFQLFIVLILGLACLGQSMPEGAVPYPSKFRDITPQQAYCGYEYWNSCTSWYCYPTHQECTRTWRCNFFFGKGCYQIYECVRECTTWQRYCCYDEIWGYPTWCDEWELVGQAIETKRQHEFLYCGCTGVSGGECF